MGVLKWNVQINYDVDGWSEDYFSGGTATTGLEARVTALCRARAALLIKRSNLYVYGCRVSQLDKANPVRSHFYRAEAYSPSAYSTTGGLTDINPNDAVEFEITSATATKVMELRGPPDNYASLFGSAPAPTGIWVDTVKAFFIAQGVAGFGIYTTNKPAIANIARVVSIAPAVAPTTLPLGTLVLTTNPVGLLAPGIVGTVVLRNCRCRPALRTRHVAIGQADGTIYLKNTDVGQIQYQPNSGGVFVLAPTVDTFTAAAAIRAATKKCGPAHGSTKARRLSRV